LPENPQIVRSWVDYIGGALSHIPVEFWTTLAIIIVCVIFGAFGGLVGHYINNENEPPQSENPTKSTWFSFPSRGESGAIGIGGAIAFMFFIIAVGGVTNFATVDEQLRTVAVSVIAGFGARSLLPRMVGQLEKQIAQASAKADTATEKADSATEKADNASSEAGAATAEAKRLEALVRETDEKFQVAKLQMKLLEAAHPQAQDGFWKPILENGLAAIRSGGAGPEIYFNVARVQRWHGLIDNAIDTLTNAINVFRELPEERSRPLVNFGCFNRACYYYSRFKEGGNKDDNKNALRDVEMCLQKAHDPAAEIESMRRDLELGDLTLTTEFELIATRFD
jgi:Alanine-zipper, major outer membrane lipoprotein